MIRCFAVSIHGFHSHEPRVATPERPQAQRRRYSLAAACARWVDKQHRRKGGLPHSAVTYRMPYRCSAMVTARIRRLHPFCAFDGCRAWLSRASPGELVEGERVKPCG